MENRITQYNRRINYLITETDAAYHDLARVFGLSDSVLMIFYALTDADGQCPLASIYRQTGCSKQTINSALRKLEAEKLVYLRPADGKSKIVCLTERGAALAGRTAGVIQRAENEIYASWPEGELQEYLRLTQKYLDALREKTSEMRNMSL